MTIVDFSHVPSNQTEIHDRLENWAKWCKPNHTSSMLAMFKGYKPYLYPDRGPSSTTNSKEAAEVQKTLAFLPEKHRHAIQWFYIFKSNPTRMCMALGVSKQGLFDLVTDGRTMVKNRLTVRKDMCINAAT